MIYQEFEKEIKALTYVDRQAVRDEVMQGMDDFIGTMAQIVDERERRQRIISKAYNEDRKIVSGKISKVMKRFAEALSKEYGTGCEKVDAAVFVMSNDGHSDLHDLESRYEEIAALANIAYKTGYNSRAAESIIFGVEK